MTNAPYGLFCPLAMAAEILERRWTLLILGEMWSGFTRFNDIRRSVPGISPTLLAKRLRELEACGLVERVEDPSTRAIDYIRTPKAIELEPVLQMLSDWAYRNIEKDIALKDVNIDYLLWNICQRVEASKFPKRRVTILFHITDIEGERAKNWLIVKPDGSTEICMADPKFDVDLYFNADSKSLASVFMGHSKFDDERASGKIFVSGDSFLTRTIDDWFVKSSYAYDECQHSSQNLDFH